MKHLHVLARPLAATAVVGVALLGFAGVAGAATVSVSVPPVLGNLGSNPIVTVGSGTVTPLPGAVATVPAHGDETASVDNPAIDAAPVASVPQGHIVSEHSSVDACVAAALLTDEDPAGCGSGVGSAPSLTRSLANVGACVRLAVADGQSIDGCSTSSSAAGATVTNPTVNLASIAPDGLDNQVAGVLAGNGLCAVAAELGLPGVLPCGTGIGTIGNGTGGNGSGTASGGIAASGSRANADVCVGLAVITGADASRCAPSATVSAHAPATHKGARGTTINAGPAGTVGASEAPVPNAACAPRESSTGTSSPFRSEALGGLAGLGFVLAGIGRRVRRTRRPVTA